LYGNESDGAINLFKLLLHQSKGNEQLKRMEINRICDWLFGVDSKWLADGWKTSFFCQYFIGLKTKEEIIQDTTLQDKIRSKSLAILHWDPREKEEAFCVSVRTSDDKSDKFSWKHFYLQNKGIGDTLLLKEAEKLLTQQYKGKKPEWYKTTLFNPLKKVDAYNCAYTFTGAQNCIFVY